MAQFLRGPWRDYLTECYLERDVRPEPWHEAMEKTEVLIWSVLPKGSRAETNQLRVALPALLACLNAGLDRVGFGDADRLAFLNYLMKRQTQSLRRTAPMAMPLPPAPAADEPEESLAIDLPFDHPEATTGSALQRDQWFALDLGLAQPIKYRLSWISPKRTKYVFTSRDGGDPLIKTLAEVEDLLASGALTPVDAVPLVQRAIAASAGVA
jgi:hypothetical protein